MMKPRSTSSEGHGPEPTPDDTDHERSWPASSLRQAERAGLMFDSHRLYGDWSAGLWCVTISVSKMYEHLLLTLYILFVCFRLIQMKCKLNPESQWNIAPQVCRTCKNVKFLFRQAILCIEIIKFPMMVHNANWAFLKYVTTYYIY